MTNHTKVVTKALIYPRLTPEYLESLVVEEQFHHFPNSRVTVCCITSINSHEFVGVAICGEKDRFEITTGRRIAREKALSNLMEMERYLMRQRLHEATKD